MIAAIAPRCLEYNNGDRWLTMVGKAPKTKSNDDMIAHSKEPDGYLVPFPEFPHGLYYLSAQLFGVGYPCCLGLDGLAVVDPLDAA